MNDLASQARGLRTWFGLAALAVAAIFLVACDEGEAGSEPANPLITIEVGENALSPQSVEVQPPDRYRLVVENQTDEECSFNFGNYVRDLPVPPGESVEMGFEIPPDTPAGELEMGCAGSPDQVGEVIVREGTVLD